MDFGLSVLNRVYNLKQVCPKQGLEDWKCPTSDIAARLMLSISKQPEVEDVYL